MIFLHLNNCKNPIKYQGHGLKVKVNFALVDQSSASYFPLVDCLICSRDIHDQSLQLSEI